MKHGKMGLYVYGRKRRYAKSSRRKRRKSGRDDQSRSTGAAGLYDLVGGTFYTNSGTGAFTAGAEIGKAEDREWQEGDVLYRPQWTTYLSNVQRLRDAYYTLAETGELPKPGDKLGYVGANSIEKVLADIDLLIDCMKSSYRRCGTFRAGNNAAHLPLKGSI